MAVIATVETPYGESRELYIRLNNFDQIANHDVPAVARFRGFLSREKFEAGASFMFEKIVSIPASDFDITKPAWPQAYAALKASDGFSGSIDD